MEIEFCSIIGFELVCHDEERFQQNEHSYQNHSTVQKQNSSEKSITNDLQ